MARWSIVREQGRGAGKVRLVYQNLFTLQQEELGQLMSDVPDAWVVDWIFQHADHLHPGDLIQLSSGRMLHFSHERGAA
jgi:hypothetical protein